VVPLSMTKDPDWIMCASSDGHAMAVLCEDVSLLSGPGRGVIVMKLAARSQSGAAVNLIGAELGHRDLDTISVKTAGGKERSLTLRSLQGTRGGKGSWVVKRGGFTAYRWRPVETPRIKGSDE